MLVYELFSTDKNHKVKLQNTIRKIKMKTSYYIE